MSDFKTFRRKGFIELREVTQEEIKAGSDYLIEKVGVSVSQEDIAAGSPREGDMVAVNPENGKDLWLVSKDYFEKNYESTPECDVVENNVQERKCCSDTCNAKKSDFNDVIVDAMVSFGNFLLSDERKESISEFKNLNEVNDVDLENFAAKMHVDLSEGKTYHNTVASEAKENVKDIVFWGDGDTFKLISKASSKKEKWMKSTKVMEIKGLGCVVQVTTQQGDNVAEAVTFVPGAKVKEIFDDNKKLVSRILTV